jgi:hypothetical protein
MTADLLAVDAAWNVTVGRERLVAALEARLTAQGALIELRQLQGLSASEMDLLVHREIHQPSSETRVIGVAA